MIRKRGADYAEQQKDNHSAFFGLKCVLLALSILMIAGAIILGSLYPVLEENNTCLVIDLTAIVIVSVVMILEVKPYLETKNVGIRNIYREKDIEIEKFGKFDRMVEKNTFCYNFQPIVEAKTGNVFAYEALMRSPKEVGLSPREILKYAEISQKLYSIEYCTFYNTLRAYHENKEKFGGRKMFINSIPSVVLNEKDLALMTEKFGDITENTVVEILEDDEDTKESCTYFEKASGAVRLRHRDRRLRERLFQRDEAPEQQSEFYQDRHFAHQLDRQRYEKTASCFKRH